MSPEIERARRLLAQSETTLEDSYNRPHVDIDWAAPQVVVPVRRKQIQEETMEPKANADWDAWARRIVRQESVKTSKAIVDGIAEGLAKLLGPINERMRKLEAEIDALKLGTVAKHEWPIRIKDGVDERR